MEFYAEVLASFLSREHAHIIFPDLNINAKEIVELECYKALMQIKAVLEDDSLEDSTCFQRIEEIVCIFEQLGSRCGARHDF